MAELRQGSQRPKPDVGDRARRGHLRVSDGHSERSRHGGKTAAAGRSAGPLDRHRSDPAGGTHHAAQQGVGRDGGKLFIAWEASDNRELAAKPISLSYSERLGGPWTPMASGLENTGRYAWQLTGSLPQRMYLRLEIHDAAGNMGIYETPEPVTLDLSSPAAQLRDLRPLGRLRLRSAG